MNNKKINLTTAILPNVKSKSKSSSNFSKTTTKSNSSITSNELTKFNTTQNHIEASKIEIVTKSNNVVIQTVQNNFTTSYNKNTKNSETSNSKNLFIYIIVGISSIIAIGIFIKLLRRLVLKNI